MKNLIIYKRLSCEDKDIRKEEVNFSEAKSKAMDAIDDVCNVAI